MSVMVDVYPEIIIAGEPIRVTVRNPTNSTVTVRVDFYTDNTRIMSILFENVPSAGGMDTIIPDEISNLSNYTGKIISVIASVVT